MGNEIACARMFPLTAPLERRLSSKVRQQVGRLLVRCGVRRPGQMRRDDEVDEGDVGGSGFG